MKLYVSLYLRDLGHPVSGPRDPNDRVFAVTDGTPESVIEAFKDYARWIALEDGTILYRIEHRTPNIVKGDKLKADLVARLPLFARENTCANILAMITPYEHINV